jgi:transposase
MPTQRGVRRDFAALKARRFRAARLFARGASQAAVARTLAVTPMTACRWYRDWKSGGRAGLQGAGRAGRKPRLDAAQRARLDAALRNGAKAHGFGTELWTLRRVAAVIQRLTGVRYHPGHVWYLLRQLTWSVQRPARRARERDDAAIRQWVRQRWPAVKKTSAASAPGSSSKTKAGSRPSQSSAARGHPGGEPLS